MIGRRGVLAGAAAAWSVAATARAEPETLIRGARVFDGTGAPARILDVLVRGDRIAAVGPRLNAPGARLVDASGLTLLPGLHDLHTHLRSPAISAPDDLGKAYAAYLLHGVTSVNDYSLSGEMIAPIRAMTGSGAVLAPRLRLAVRLGVPGGHGTEYGWGSFFTLQATTPRAARLQTQRALAYRPDLLKVFADGWRYGRPGDRNSMDQATLAAIVEIAHAAGVPVVTHTVTRAGAAVAAAAGVDALVHGVGDALLDDATLALMKAKGTAYVPTLAVYEPREARRLSETERAGLNAAERAADVARTGGPVPELEARRWQVLRDNVRRVRAAGIRIGVGTDAGVGGVFHGLSTLREIRLLVECGLSPADALAAATSASAAILGKAAEQGRIAPGIRADLLLTGGRPDLRLEDLHDVRQVFVGGRAMPLPTLRTLRDGGMSPLPVHRMAGPIDTGTRGDGRTDLGTLPVDSTESGADHSHLAFARPERSLFLVARLGAQPRPFAQLVLPLTPGAVQLADARGFTGIAFEARGAGRYAAVFDSYGVLVDSRFRAGFEAGPQRREVRLPFATFDSPDPAAPFDPAVLRALAFELDGEPGGTAWLELSNIRFV
jgi:imidazolonepropionase-like amidohydrolase